MGTSPRKIVVAVEFDERLGSLLSAAAFFGRRLGATLRLAHVTEPWTRSTLAAAVERGPAELVQALKDEATRVAGRRLAALRATLPPGLAVETVLLSGDLAPALAADAEAQKADLLIVGADRAGFGGATLGLSTAVSILSEAPCPVLVLNEAARLDPELTRLTLVVADDFSEASLPAVTAAARLAEALPGSTLVHVHVVSTVSLRLDRIHPAHAPHAPHAANRAAAAEGPPLTPAGLATLLAEAEGRLRSRAGEAAARLEAAGSHYRTDVVTGAVPDELERTAVAYRADVGVFGHHRVFHRETRHVGQMPFKVMLSQERPVLVVPPPG